jgi:hypothetical protein
MSTSNPGPGPHADRPAATPAANPGPDPDDVAPAGTTPDLDDTHGTGRGTGPGPDPDDVN